MTRRPYSRCNLRGSLRTPVERCVLVKRNDLGNSVAPREGLIMSSRAASSVCVLFVCVNATAGELIIPGTGDGLEMLRHLGSAYSEKNPGTNVIVPASTGSGGGKMAVVQD